MSARTGWRSLLALVGLAALAAACTPVTVSTTPPVSTSSCASAAAAEPAPTPQDPVEYVAVVDEPGPGQPDVVTFTASSEAEKAAAVDDLADDGTVLAVEPNGEVSAQIVDPSDDPLFTFQTGPPKAELPAAWAAGFDGTGIRIAIVDSGVRATHEDLTPRVVTGRDFVATPSDPLGVPGGTTDDFGHGTHVAGIAAASDNTVGVVGAAPASTVVPVKVLNSNGTGSFDGVARGINWAADPNKGDADVINLSLGGGGCSSTIGTAVAYAKSQGVTVVAAAGNDSATTAFSPASFDGEVVAVAATNTDDTKASFSNYGTYVDLGAPGVNIRSTAFNTDIAYGDKTGTSMASPMVAGAVALYLQRCALEVPPVHPSFDTVRSALINSASMTVPGFAFGRLDAGALVAEACA
jgi:subtilisin family serine protease